LGGWFKIEESRNEVVLDVVKVVILIPLYQAAQKGYPVVD
jgi:hypothetical protein